MCEKFSAFFHEKISKAKAKISVLRAQLTSTPPTLPSGTSNSAPLLDILDKTTEYEVSKLIAKLSNKTSPLDYIHTSVLKSCSVVLTPLIVHLGNLSFEEGRFPDQFKTAQ